MLKGLGTGGSLVVVHHWVGWPGGIIASRLAASIQQGNNEIDIDVVRAEDFLRLRFKLVNLVIDTSVPNQPVLVRANNREALIVVVFPPQHLAEHALFELNGVITEKPGFPSASDGIAARLSGSSRLAFVVPDNVQSIPFTLDALLGWSSFWPKVVPAAGGVIFKVPNWRPPPIRAPRAHESAIEAPWWLILSAGPNQAWGHASAPVTHGGRTELWHTRLATLVNGKPDEAMPDGVRAVWARDPKFRQLLKGNGYPPAGKPADNPFTPEDGMPVRTTYAPKDRVDVVRNTSDYSRAKDLFPYLPKPFATERLMLSALGAWIDIDGQWTSPFNDLAEWRHRATLGRDHYVRIVNRGYVHPFGHRAVKVRVGERKFLNGNGQVVVPRGAYVTFREFIVVTQRLRTYPAALGLPDEGRRFPFAELLVVTAVTRDVGFEDPVGPDGAFQPLDSQNGPPVPLTFRGTDWEGHSATFAAPFVFVPETIAYDTQKMAALNTTHYPNLASARREADLGGQRVGFAQPSKPGDTTFPVDKLVFGASNAISQASASAYRAADQLRGFPEMAKGLIKLPTVEQLAGAAGLSPEIEYAKAFIDHGFDLDPSKNPGEAFLAFTKGQAMKFATENAGGVVNPNAALSGVTRRLGPVAGDLADIVKDRFDPDKVFNDLTAKILGGIPLKDILNAVNDVRNDVDKAVRYVEDRLPDELVVRFKWTPDLKKDEPLHIFEPKSDPKTTAFLEGEAHQGVKDPQKRSWRFHGEINNFRINLFGDGKPNGVRFLVIDVSRFAFTSAAAQKTDVTVRVDEVAFDGPLKFVNELRKYLPGMSDGLDSVRIPTAVTASMGFAIPAVAVGVFQLSNLSFSAAVTIPLTGEPVRVRFGFSSRKDPFLLTISSFGGGGWFAIGLGVDGVEMLEIGFDFGGSLALNVGIAQGGVDVVAGTYLKLERKNGGELVTLEGFLKLHGAVNVLGLISVTIDLYLSFQFLHKSGPPERNIFTGRAKLTLKIQILFFSVSVSVDVQQSFGGDPKDPTFAQAISANDWSDYAAAFAPV